ncbi:AAA family ATPase [Mycolicibacterium sp. XJ2546]
MRLTERARELGELTAAADDARNGAGGVVIVCGESGAGKTSFVDSFAQIWPDRERIIAAACDPLSTPRPLGPIHDLAEQLEDTTQELLRDGARPYEIYSAVFDDFSREPSVVVIDDLHWADQGTVDLLRFVLRRVHRTRSLVVGTVRDDEITTTHPMRALLGDVARAANAKSLTLPPLSIEAVTDLVGDSPIDPTWLHGITGGNAFFVTEMLDHAGTDLPTTVRDAILSRTVGLDVLEWDLLYLLACASGPIPDALLVSLGVTVPTLRALNELKLIRRSDRGVAFRHDLCRLAVSSVIPPGAEPALHRRMIEAYESASLADPAVITHHVLGTGDPDRIRLAASDAGRAAARSGAHRQAIEFYRIALDRGGPVSAHTEAELLELLAHEYFLTDQLPDAIAVRNRALRLRQQTDLAAAVSVNHNALAMYEWSDGNRSSAEHHAAQAIAVLEGQSTGPVELALIGHATATQALIAVMAGDLNRTETLLARARSFARKTDDQALAVWLRVIEGYRGYAGDGDGRSAVLAALSAAPVHFDDIYSHAYAGLIYLDVEHRRLEQAAELLDVGLPLSIERDVPLARSWQLGERARMQLFLGDWDDALVDAETVLTTQSGQLARAWPLLVRGLIALRRDESGAADIEEQWQLVGRLGEPIRRVAGAAGVVELSWLSGEFGEQLHACRALLEGRPNDGLQWSRGELGMWLHRIDPAVDAEDVAEPYRLLLTGECEAAADEFLRLSMPYEAALAFVDSADPDLARRGLDMLDRLGANAVAARVRGELRAQGMAVVPARRRSSTLTNPAGLTMRQVDVLRLMGDGLTNAELAERLYLSVKTVDKHVSAILTKLHAGNRREAVRSARALGILD